MVNLTLSVCRVWLMPASEKSEKKSAFDTVRLTALTGRTGPVPARRSGSRRFPSGIPICCVLIWSMSPSSAPSTSIFIRSTWPMSVRSAVMLPCTSFSSTITREKSVLPVRSISLTDPVMAFDAALTA